MTMKSRTIVKEAAKELTDRIVQAHIKDEVEAIEAEHKAMAKLVIDMLEANHLTISKLPVAQQPSRTRRIYIWSGEGQMEIAIGDYMPEGEERDWVFCDYRIRLSDLTGPLVDKIRSFLTIKSAAILRHDRLAREIYDNIRTAKTTKRLIEAWPETEQIVVDYYGEDDGVETPLSEIIKRNMQALPAPEGEAA